MIPRTIRVLVTRLAPSSAHPTSVAAAGDGSIVMLPVPPIDTCSVDDERAPRHQTHTLDDHDPGLRRGNDEFVAADRLKAVGSYERAWTVPAEGNIRDELELCWTPDSTHVNPFTDTVQGIDGLTRLILDFPIIFPGAAFRIAGTPDLHHDVARFAWQLRSTARIRMLGRDFGFSVEGLDYVEFDKQNKIRKVVSFYGPLAPDASGVVKARTGTAGARQQGPTVVDRNPALPNVQIATLPAAVT
jgi:hypothetical protein